MAFPRRFEATSTASLFGAPETQKELDLLMTEFSGQIPKEKLLRAYHAVMNKDPDDRHACLFVDLNPKPHHPSPFRINYTDWLILDD